MRSRLKWAGHVDKMEVERLMKRADTTRVEGRRRGRPRLRWEDCVRFGRSGKRVENDSEGWGSRDG